MAYLAVNKDGIEKVFKHRPFREKEEWIEEVKNDKVGHSEIISDLKEMYRKRIDWLESLKERMNKTNKILKTQTL